MEIRFKLNGEVKYISIDPSTRLLDLLRDEFKLTSVKEGCGEGECGACVVLMNNKAVNSCLIPVGNIVDTEIETIEGFKETKQFKTLEESYLEAGAVQCGFCTPGMIISSEGLLRQNPHPTDSEIKEALSGNLCRCTGYNMIINAVKLASEKGEGLW